MSTLHFPGDCRNYEPGRVMGPDTFGGFWQPVSTQYNPTQDRTTMTLAVVPPDRWSPAMIEARKEWEAVRDKRTLDLALAGHKPSVEGLKHAATDRLEAAKRAAAQGSRRLRKPRKR